MRAAVPGTTDAIGRRRRRIQRRRGRSAAPGDGFQALYPAHGRTAGTVLRRHAEARVESPDRPPTASTRRWPHSPISVSRKVIRRASPRWCSIRRGSNRIIRRPSAPPCCALSRWVSTRRSRWSLTPGGIGVGVLVHRPHVNASLPWATLENAGTQVRLGLPRCAVWETRWRSGHLS